MYTRLGHSSSSASHASPACNRSKRVPIPSPCSCPLPSPTATPTHALHLFTSKNGGEGHVSYKINPYFFQPFRLRFRLPIFPRLPFPFSAPLSCCLGHLCLCLSAHSWCKTSRPEPLLPWSTIPKLPTARPYLPLPLNLLLVLTLPLSIAWHDFNLLPRATTVHIERSRSTNDTATVGRVAP